MTHSKLQERLDYYDLVTTGKSTYGGVSRALGRQLDKALETFYRVIGSRPELSGLFENPQQMAKARGLQAEHWRAVFRDGVDERFYQRATRIGNVHARIGLEPKWYVGAYGLMLDQLVTAIIAPGWRGWLPWRRALAREVSLLIKVSLLDIDLALSAYFDDEAAARTMVNDRLGRALEQVAAGQLDIMLDGFPKDFLKIQSDFNSAIGSLRQTLANVVHGVDAIDTGSLEIRAAADDLARRTEEQAANLAQTALAVAAVTTSVEENATTSAKAHVTIAETNARTQNGAQIVSEAVSAMRQIESSSQEISSIIAVIESISFQTNLLALNAGVEAARAGEAGKGFAVVAGEVRALAQRCAEAADEVKALVTASASHVSNGVALVGRSGEAFAAIDHEVGELSHAIQSIADAAAEQANKLKQINAVVGELDRSTQQNAAMAEQCTAAASSLSQEAGGLHASLDRFDVGNASARAGAERAKMAQAA